MKSVEEKEIPEFKTLEEEREYWEARGPLAPGHSGRWSQPKEPWSERKTKRTSFLVLRLTGSEITRLRDIAVKQGLGVSTFARKALMDLVEREEKKGDDITLDEVKQAADEFLLRYEALKKETAPVLHDKERDRKP